MYYICKNYSDKIRSVDFNCMNPNVAESSQNWQYGYWDKFIKDLEVLSKVEALKEAIINIYKCVPSFLSDSKEITISSSSYSNFKRAKKSLEDKIDTIISLYESLGFVNNNNGFDVKLPEIHSISELNLYLKELDFFINQCPYLKSEKEEIKFRCLDVGSTWVSFFVVASGTTIILKNLATIIDTAIKVKSHIKNVDQQCEQLRSMQVKNEVIEEVVKAYNEANKVILTDCVNDLENKLGELKDGEERGKTEKCLEKFSWLIDKGLQIYTSIDAPKEVKDLFPMNESFVKLDESVPKLLDDKNTKL